MGSTRPLGGTTPPVPSTRPSMWGVAAALLCLTAASDAKPHDDVEDDLASFFGWRLDYDLCEGHAECLARRPCEWRSDCDVLQDCVNGFCACDYPLPTNYKCYIPTDNGTFEEYSCEDGTCSLKPSPMAELMPLALTIGVCFVVAVTAMLACKMLIKRMHAANPARRLGDGDADSVSSMQRWINERLRDRPPRYEEMVSAASSSSAHTAPSQPAAGPATISAAVTEAEKPPAYEVVVNERQMAGPYCPRTRAAASAVADNIPPPLYSAEAMADGAEAGCYRNPCFLGDAEDPPPYSASAYAASGARSTRSASLPDPICPSLFDPFEPSPEISDSSFAASSSGCPSTFATASTPPSSPTSSMTSFASCDSSSSSSFLPLAAGAGVDLLTVSQAVALKEMMLAEGDPAAAAVDRPVLWTSTC
ncbi:uncharacterized protein LOC117650104 [Thrips palmi]|uniref:Uncharacterized protein LOC117650104 n=1 Tax=Thrips palmi TaxID=161013 RepID=A0A6P8ZVF2_THRPL|nr:uncharacterized protein LOC117650104 [Thrips palmi]XP_034249309.1 uncharacterized protein LOC117650104 [Thrips palmi]